MEITNISKLLFGIITAIGTIAVTFYNIGQSQKARAELLGNFEEAVKNKRKHSVSELFRLLHGLRMNYTDIITLIKDDECSKIIYALRQTPGLVHYVDGDFQYTQNFSNRWVFLFGRLIPKIFAGIFGVALIVMILLATFATGVQSLTAWIMVVGFSIIFGTTIKQIAYDKLIENLVNRKT